MVFHAASDGPQAWQGPAVVIPAAAPGRGGGPPRAGGSWGVRASAPQPEASLSHARGPHRRGQRPGPVTCAVTQKGLARDFLLCHPALTFLHYFLNKGPVFSFCNDTTGPAHRSSHQPIAIGVQAPGMGPGLGRVFSEHLHCLEMKFRTTS